MLNLPMAGDEPARTCVYCCERKSVQVTATTIDVSPGYVEPEGTLDAKWHRAPPWKQLVFAVIFVSLFLLMDGSSKASQAWEGAPPCYLPVGLAVALMLCGGVRYVPLLFLSTILAAI